MFTKIKPYFQAIVIILIVFFIGKILWDNWSELQDFDWQINWWYFILAIMFHTLSFFVLGFSWNRILTEVSGQTLDTKKVWKIFFTSQIIRYIPGNVWSFINLGVANSEKLGIRKTHTLLAIFIEIALRMAVGALISVIVLYEIFHKFSLFYYAILVITVFGALFVIFNQKILNSILNWLFRKKGENFISQAKFKKRTLVGLSGIFALHWIVFGIGLYFLIISLGIDISIYKAIGVDILSWIVGYLSLITPSGVGVREATMIILLSPYMTVAIATVVSLLARLMFVIGELLNLGLVYIFTKEK
ncbi:MAG: lysylphosphatidylglycerol synthase transmembrane domain-containing protein [bacterium]